MYIGAVLLMTYKLNQQFQNCHWLQVAFFIVSNMGEKNLLQDKAELHDDSKHMKLIKDARTESIYENLVNWMNG